MFIFISFFENYIFIQILKSNVTKVGGELGLIFAWYVPLASQSPCSVAESRPHLSYLVSEYAKNFKSNLVFVVVLALESKGL